MSHADWLFIDVTRMASMHCNMGATIRASAVT